MFVRNELKVFQKGRLLLLTGKFGPLIILVVTFFFVRTFLLTPITVSGDSMYPALQDGDSVVVWRMYPQVGKFDIIVFEMTQETYYVKRVIGKPGQIVRYVNNQLYIDETPVEEPFLSASVWTEDFSLQDIVGDRFKDRVIPQGYFLVLGDPRQDTLDSRHFGLIHEEQILGRALWVQWPLSRFGWVD
ncbi:MAG: signal peptidase I [Turicibacter sp.]|nr:signal peptidase I [Turicibacter sp.]